MNNIYLNVFYDNLDKYIKIMNDELSKSLELQPLGEHIKMVGGFAFKSKDYIQSGVPIIRISDFNNEKIDLSSAKYYKEDKTLERYELNKGDIIIAMTGGTIGKLAIVQEGLGKLYLNQRVGKFEVLNPNEFVSEYVYWLARGIQSIVQNLGYGGAQPNVSNKQIEALEFPFPDKSFQRSIVSFFNDLRDDCISRTYFNKEIEKKILALQELGVKIQTINNNSKKQFNLISKLRQSVLQEAVQGKLTADWRKNNPNIKPASELLRRIKKEKEQLIADKKIKKEKPLSLINQDEIPYELPQNWEWCRLTDLVNVGTGSTPSKSNMSYYLDGTIPWYTSSATNSLYTKEPKTHITKKALKETNCKIFPKGSLIIALYGQGKTRGQISELQIAGATNQAIAAMVFYKSSIQVKTYLKYFFRKIYDEIRLLAEGGAQPNLNVGKIKSTLIPLPPLNELNMIVQKVDVLIELCQDIEKQVKHSKHQAEQLMQAVLQEVFNPKANEDSNEVVKELFPDIETIAKVANLQQAMIVQKTELGLGSGRGKVYLQKTSANLKNIKGADIPYNFEKSHHGEFSYQLSEDLDKNPYLRKVKTDVGEIYEIKSSMQHEVLNALKKPENAAFTQSIDELVKVYQNPLINGSTDRIELLNTVWRAIKDTKSLLGNTIYSYLEGWEIKQGHYKTKADKFTKSETFAMINLIKNLGWDKKLIQG